MKNRWCRISEHNQLSCFSFAYCNCTMSEGSPSRDAILALKQPTVFHGMISDWDVLKWDIEEWGSVFGNSQLPFRCSSKVCSLEPVWESRCSKEMMTLKEFADFQRSSSALPEGDKWCYFDYKYIHEWTSISAEEKDPLHSVKWTKLGFPEIDARASTIWIGSRGAHTPCHFDTYGSNLVAQVFGTKQWILFPLDETNNMKPTRIPYEESSVYSQWNFNSPLPSDFYDQVRNSYIITLNPGDVLYVPRHWWHYVETLDTSISINTWLPNSLDDIGRLDEALVKFIVSQIVKNLSNEEKSKVLNPNEDKIDQALVSDSLTLIQACIGNVRKDPGESTKNEEPPPKQFKCDISCNPSTTLQFLNASVVSCCETSKLKNLIDKKCTCSSLDYHQTMIMKEKSTSGVGCLTDMVDEPSVSVDYLGKVINAFCHPDVISMVRQKLYQKS